MLEITKAFDQLFAEKQVPVTKKELENNLVLYTFQFQVTTQHAVGVEIVLEQTETVADVQVTYRQVAYLTNYQKRFELLERLNQLNSVKSGYYTLFLAGDGEVYMRALMRTNVNIDAVYKMIYTGSAIVRHLLPNIEEITGQFIHD